MGTDLKRNLISGLWGFIAAVTLVVPVASGARTSQVCADLFQAPRYDVAAQSAAHDSIAHDLYRGEIIHAVPFSANNNRNPVWLLTLKNNRYGRTRLALFKPRPYGDGGGWNRTPMEYVAYELNRLLGMDLVPPAAYRRNVRIAGHTYAEGALLYLVPDAHRLADVHHTNWGLRQDLFLSDTRILDILLENPDRHIDNFVRGRHWVDGSYRPILIDHAAGLRGSGLRLSQNNAFGTGGVTKIRARTLRKLQELSLNDLRSLRAFMSEREMRAILARRDALLNEVSQLHVSTSLN